MTFDYHEAGLYVFEVIVDGTKTTCTATLPSTTNGSCDRPELAYFYVAGSRDPPLNGLTILSTTAKQVAIHATKDGVQLADLTFAPSYTVSPGPNGPDCEPKECRLATHTFP